MKTKLRGAIIGCGMISEYHLKAWKRIPEVEIVALVSRTREHALERQEQFAPGAAIYQDMETALQNESLDFVDILTPPFLHYQHCLLGAKYGVHVICQKPLTDDIAEGRDLVRRMAGTGKLFAIHENHRYRPWFRTILQKIKEGFFGNIRYLKVEQHSPSEPDVLYKLNMKNGVLLEHGTHLIDMAHAIFGPPDGIRAWLQRVSDRIQGESLAHVVLSYPSATAVIDCAWKPGGLLQAGLVLQGENGEAWYQGSLVRGDRARFVLTQGKRIVFEEERSPQFDYEESFYLFQMECTEAMLRNDLSLVTQTGAKNLATLETTFSAYESAESERPVIRVSGL